jgi:exopolysaccharide biosynthesis predicted pyruvyltransferase EpsI
MQSTFEKLANDIKTRSDGKKIIYIPNPGNYGDGLIRYATKKLFSDFGIDHREVNVGYGIIKYQLLPYLLKSSQYLFVYGGGGGWCKAYDCGYRVAKAISLFTDNLVVLPSTYEFDVSKIRGKMYRRDKFESKDINPRADFCHDMAFYLTVADSKDFYKQIKPTKGSGLLMRTDKEAFKVTENMPSQNIDVSCKGDHMSNGDAFLQEVASYNTIYTDRLHVCIAGLVAGRNVQLYPGSYFKIKRIFESSIQNNFENVVLNEPCNDINALEKLLNK